MSESHISHDAAFEQKHVEDLERIRGFRLMDDDFMSKVFEDQILCRAAAPHHFEP